MTEVMKITETYSAEETFALGRQIGQQAKAGEVYTLIGDLGVGKTVCLSIISMCTGSGTWRRWRRSAMRTVSTARASV